MWFCFALVGCRSKQEVTVAVDTTKIARDSLAVSSIRTEVCGAAVDYGEWGCIEFADSGGVLRIDSSGLVARGVKGYHRGVNMALTQNSMAQQETDSVMARQETDGVMARRSENRGVTSRGELQVRKSGVTVELSWGVCGLVVIVLLLWVRRKWGQEKKQDSASNYPAFFLS